MGDPRYSEWLHSHDTGLSSEAIFHYMTLGVTGGSHPHDPADLARCLRLLARFPEWRERLPEMANVGKGWALLLPHWAEVERSFIEEAGGKLPKQFDTWSAPKTYKMMSDIFYYRDENGSLRAKYAEAA